MVPIQDELPDVSGPVEKSFVEPLVDGLHPRSLSDRMQALEQQMRDIQSRLGRLEGRLKSLDARVGGASGEKNLNRNLRRVLF